MLRGVRDGAVVGEVLLIRRGGVLFEEEDKTHILCVRFIFKIS